MADEASRGDSTGDEPTLLEATDVALPRPAPPPPPLADYEIEGEIARGGMGIVYRARQRSLARTVAIKRILAGSFARKEEIQRFRSEAEAAAALRHPGIVAIHEIGEADGLPYFTMEFVDGATLSAVLRERSLPAREAAACVREVAGAIQYAHEHGIVHRDLKPSNILVGRDGRYRVTDFGLARRTGVDSGLTASGALLGTPEYMSPEQARGDREAIGPSTDVYSLGAVLYELLAGRPPFRGPTALDVALRVRDAEPLRPTLADPSIDRDLETICLKCLEKTPARRYASAGALAADLARWLGGEPVLARPIGRLARAGRWCLRRPLVAGLAGALALAVAAGVAGIGWQWRKAERARRDAEAERDRSQEARREAEAAREEARARLVASLFQQARGLRIARSTGGRSRGLALLGEALALERDSGRLDPGEVRAEAFELLLGLDLRLDWSLPAIDWRLGLAAASADGSRVAVLEYDASDAGWRLRVVDGRTGAPIAALSGSGGLPGGIALDRTGDRLAMLWRRGVEIRRLPAASVERAIPGVAAAGTFHDLRFLGDDALLAVEQRIADRSSDLVLWDLEEEAPPGERIHLAERPIGLASDDDGRLLAWRRGRSEVVLFDVSARREVETIEAPAPLVGAPAFVRGANALILPCGGTSGGCRVVVRDLPGRRTLLDREIPVRFGQPVNASSGPFGTILLAGEGTVHVAVVDARTGDLLQLAAGGHESSTRILRAAPDDPFVITAGGRFSLRRWEALRPAERRLSLPEREIGAMAFRPGGRELAVAGDGVWIVGAGHDGEPRSLGTVGQTAELRFDGEGATLLALALRELASWSVGTGEERLRLTCPRPPRRGPVAPDGVRLLSAAFADAGAVRLVRSADFLLQVGEAGRDDGWTDLIRTDAANRAVLDREARSVAILSGDPDGARSVVVQRLPDREVLAQLEVPLAWEGASQRVHHDLAGGWMIGAVRRTGAAGVEVVRWTLPGGRETWRAPIAADVVSIAVARGGGLVALATTELAIEIRRIEDGVLVHRWGTEAQPGVLALSDDGGFLAWAEAGSAELHLLDLAWIGSELERLGLR